MERQYRPNNTVIGIAGAVSHDEAVRFVADATGDLDAGRHADLAAGVRSLRATLRPS